MSASPYVKPVGAHLTFSPKTRRLYELEERRAQAIKEAAKELGRVLGHDEREFWHRSMPEALLQVLEHFDTQASRLAAVAYLERLGLEVVPKCCAFHRSGGDFALSCGGDAANERG
jgi:hypothetical protein